MPAIDLTKLRSQVQELVVHFPDPRAFLLNLENIFRYYQNYTLRTDIKLSALNITSYCTSNQVLYSIEKELEKVASSDPLAALELTKHLWNESYLEAKVIAIYLLRVVPLDLALPILSKFPVMFHEINSFGEFLPIMISTLLILHKEYPHKFFDLVSTWLASPGMNTRGWGIKVLTGLVEENKNENLPIIFEVLKPVLSSADHSIHIELVDCLTALYKASPSETKLFIENTLKGINDPNILQIYLRVARELPEKFSIDIKNIIRSKIDHQANSLAN